MWVMPAWCASSTLYKGLITLVLALIALEYLFGSIIETKRWETIFTTNVTRSPPQNDQQQSNINQMPNHSRLIRLEPISAKFANNSSAKEILLNNSTIGEGFSSILINRMINSTIISGNSTTVSGIAAAMFANVPDGNDRRSTTILVPSFGGNFANENGLKYCPDYPPNLKGKVPVDLSHVPSVLELEARFNWLKPGGHGAPDNCFVRKRVAIVIPFRCRSEHLLLFLQHMHPFLHRQQLDYTIYVIEQEGDGPFNRAMLMNIGYTEALKIDNYDCFIFHDIDLLPEDDRNLYTCPEQPRHMSAAVDIFKYKLPYSGIFGGVSAISTEHFKLLNGFSNLFWGWGGEDDDMSNRIRYRGLHIARYPQSVARYTMLTHKKEKPSTNRYETLREGKKKFDSEGLSDLRYRIRHRRPNKLYTWVLAEIRPPS